MPGSSSSGSFEYAVLPGAGSAGLVWKEVAAALGARVLPLPDADSVPAMAEALMSSLDPGTVLVGASAGAMVALEVARRRPVPALVLLAAGFGIEVGDSFLAWVEAAPADLFPKMARASIADRSASELQSVAVADFEARGPRLVARHLRALREYRPEPLADPPPTAVIWGTLDHSVPLADHAELAARCRGIVIPVPDAGHMPFLERPQETVRWIREFVEWRLR
ncbi:MAG TPA: alpha/beta fold hydrolase [Candidatus Dormibacteraeota bacterium]